MDAIRPRRQRPWPRRLRRPFGAQRDIPTRPTTAWRSSNVMVRCAAVVLAAMAIASTVTSHVPVAGAVAVVLMVPAALVDFHTRRLPDALVLTAGVAFVAVALLTTPTLLTTPMGGRVDPVGIATGAAVMTMPLLLLHLISPESMGFGDVKATVVLGAALGAVDWQLALVGLVLAAGLGATVGTLRGSRTIPFGPFLVAAAAIALVTSPVLLSSADTSNAASSAVPATIPTTSPSMNTTVAVAADLPPGSTITGSQA